MHVGKIDWHRQWHHLLPALPPGSAGVPPASLPSKGGRDARAPGGRVGRGFGFDAALNPCAAIGQDQAHESGGGRSRLQIAPANPLFFNPPPPLPPPLDPLPPLPPPPPPPSR